MWPLLQGPFLLLPHPLILLLLLLRKLKLPGLTVGHSFSYVNATADGKARPPTCNSLDLLKLSHTLKKLPRAMTEDGCRHSKVRT